MREYATSWPGGMSLGSETHPALGARTPSRADGARAEAWLWAAVCAGHVMLGALALAVPRLGVLHAAVALTAAVWVAARRAPAAAAAAAGYVGGCEVLWRILRTPTPYEIGKYMAALVPLVVLLRMGRRAVWRPLPVLYFLMVLPSTIVTLSNPELADRLVLQKVASYTSGPLALALATWCYSQVRLRSVEFQRVVLAYLAPTLTVASYTFVATRTAGPIEFTTESNEITSGGFGPNQVSTALGLGALMAFLVAVNPRTGRAVRAVALAASVFCAAQSAMTFSRGGLYAAALGLVAGSFHFLRDARSRRRILAVGAVSAVVGAGVVWPRLNEFTGGALAARFDDTGATNRDVLMLDDVRIWMEHPVLGVGPGMVKYHRSAVSGAGHTEYSRLLAEHGVFGLAALLLLGATGLRAVSRREGTRAARGTRVALLCWSALTMVHAAMRLSLSSLVFGLAHLRVVEDCEEPADGAAIGSAPGRLRDGVLPDASADGEATLRAYAEWAVAPVVAERHRFDRAAEREHFGPGHA